ncbi:hypothetical protein CAPTEDRAFT_111097 [Capitella teleta]|uniref:Ubiquitin carboxyl-terminal hydrolase MINDY n=1 Tax=Capitella teleta TaxID=283909 RepID=R7VHH4_CAPTE|nr:hypothetical protein CAPTEDRAFT_111097 [Capitella teleta]|eukprot:ELU18027.1 hypothetical protein CAPTEDRAFT_111097 [Capitella teleta]
MSIFPSQFELDGTSGVILALYSTILSRGIAGVRSDMDDPMGKLMDDQWKCSQAMVNLLLTGRAACNVFNDVTETEDNVVMKGIQGRSEVGVLALAEHYKAGKVGTYLKTPRLPIWLIHSEKHFSVLFSLKKELLSDWKAERRFDLFYYDGLGRQQQEIRLTVAPTDDEMVPPLELCIRTKWCDAEIDWNGIDPIL